MASPNLSEIVTTTLRSRTGKLADNVTKNNALLNRLKRKGNIKPVSGGRTIVQELEYAENSTYIRYSGYQTLGIILIFRHYKIIQSFSIIMNIYLL